MRVLVSGTFDTLHPGHLAFLKEAGTRGDVTVIVARDSNVGRIKGRASLQPEDERMAAVRAAFPSYTVIPGDSEDFLKPVHAAKPDLILLGYDQKLPPGVQPTDLPCPVERAQPFEPDKYKSSLLRKNM